MANIINMENLHIAGTPCTPAVDFYFDTHRLSLTGESYPENAAAFYRPLIEQIRDYLRLLTTKSDAAEADLPPAIEFHVSLVYFNSSSTKMLFSLFNELNQAAEHKLPITLHWYYDKDDDIAEEFGEELHIDFPALDFHSHVLE
ncbi:DUF1987 domain-containing protein [Brenneria populi subsp. brevivirga]|uniref:DUF1987 domain-containing protein n=1 Tax=Brenneria populi TaxID=1505588 RepID=A0ABU6JNS6_9GAMM|nr:DUF1987 domain-containing protein [Brenneria populi subsp. brevivirga]MEC5342383.1 DUF1987 domain-containing protein [Brenneria populi Li et al. 2015]